MSDKLFHLEIITPRRTVFSAEVASVSAPGVLGGFQVLVNHAPLLSALDVGEVKVVDAESRTIRYALTGGFAEVRHNRVVLLADAAERSDEIDVDRASSARDRAEGRLGRRTADVNEERARAALARALNRLRVAGPH